MGNLNQAMKGTFGHATLSFNCLHLGPSYAVVQALALPRNYGQWRYPGVPNPTASTLVEEGIIICSACHALSVLSKEGASMLFYKLLTANLSGKEQFEVQS